MNTAIVVQGSGIATPSAPPPATENGPGQPVDFAALMLDQQAAADSEAMQTPDTPATVDGAADLKTAPAKAEISTSAEPEEDAALLAQLDPALCSPLAIIPPPLQHLTVASQPLLPAPAGKADDNTPEATTSGVVLMPTGIAAAVATALTSTPTATAALTSEPAAAATAGTPPVPSLQATSTTATVTPPAPVAMVAPLAAATPAPEAAVATPTSLPPGAGAEGAAVFTTVREASSDITMPAEAFAVRMHQAVESPLPSSFSASSMASPAASPFPPGPLAQPVRADTLLAAAGTEALPQEEGEFAEAIGTRLAWLAGQRIGRADISLSPPDLGPVQIRLDLDGQQMRVEFFSTQPEVRAALEAGLPRLRDMLSGQGLHLAHAGVGSGAEGGASRDSGFTREGRGESLPRYSVAASHDEPGSTVISLAGGRHNGLLDEYA